MMPSAGSTAIPAPLYAATPAASASTPEPTMFFARFTTAVVGAMLPAGCAAPPAMRGAIADRAGALATRDISAGRGVTAYAKEVLRMSRRSKRDAILTLREGAFFYAAGSQGFVDLRGLEVQVENACVTCTGLLGRKYRPQLI